MKERREEEEEKSFIGVKIRHRIFMPCAPGCLTHVLNCQLASSYLLYSGSWRVFICFANLGTCSLYYNSTKAWLGCSEHTCLAPLLSPANLIFIFFSLASFSLFFPLLLSLTSSPDCPSFMTTRISFSPSSISDHGTSQSTLSHEPPLPPRRSPTWSSLLHRRSIVFDTILSGKSSIWIIVIGIIPS